MSEVRETRGEPRIPERSSRHWGAFGYREFCLLWFGQLFSRIGTWMEFTALTYLIGVILSHSEAQSSLNLGLLGAAQMVPVLVFGPIGGFAADRYPRRRILIVVALVRALLAAAFALVARQQGEWVVLIALIVAAGLAGVDSFDSPARQSWLAQIVPLKMLSSAVGLGSIANNVPLMLGPAVAGIVIGTLGVYACFLVNTIAQILVAAVLFFMKSVPVSNTSREPMLRQIAEGIRYVVSHEVLRWLFTLTIVISLTVRPYALLLATFAGLVLHVDAKAYGTMLAVGGIGTVAGAIVTATWKSEHRGVLWCVLGIICSLGVASLGFVRYFPSVLVLLVVIATGWMIFSSALFVILQLQCPDEIRGRAVSLYTMIVLGLVPGGGLLMGSLASVTSLPTAYTVGGTIGVLAILSVWIARPAVRRT